MASAAAPPAPPQSPALLEALRRDAIVAFQRATAPAQEETGGRRRRPIVAAVDSALHVVLEVLAFGAGGKQLYDDLGIARLVSVDVVSMDAAAVRRQVGLSDGAARWPDHHAVAFVLPPTQAHAQLLARALEPFLSTGDAAAVHCAVLWQPAATSECALEMERQGLAGVVTQRDLALGLLPVDRHVASLCHDGVFAELYVRGQHHALTRVAQSVLAIERHGGGAPIRHVTCHGAFAGRVKAMLDTAHRLQPPPQSNAAISPPFERLILIDRMEDPLSMLLTPMTYEGLLDALIGMNHGVVRFDKTAAPSDDAAEAATETETERVKILLNHADELFDEIRDVNINTLISRRLGELTQQLVSDARGGSTQSMTATASAPALTIAQVREQLRKVPQLVQKKRSLGHHLALVEQIQRRSQSLALRTCVETEMAILSGALQRGLRVGSVSAGKDVDRALEEAVLRDEPHRLDVFDALKLLCLLSLVSGGLKEERLQWFRRQLCHAYGYHVLPLLVQLEKLELLSTKNKFDYQRRRKELSLMCGVLADDEDAGGTSDNNGGLSSSASSSSLSSVARDIHFMFPYTGYAPMSVRLVQTSLGMKIKTARDTGALFSASSSASLASTSSTGTNQSNGSTGEGDPRRVLVYYVGGVTVAELAALRWLNSSQREFEFFVATTAVCNGSRLLRAV